MKIPLGDVVFPQGNFGNSSDDCLTDDSSRSRPKIDIDDGNQDQFEQMNVQITIYALSGILRKFDESKFRVSRKLGREKDKTKLKSTSITTTSTETHSNGNSSKGTLTLKRGQKPGGSQSSTFFERDSIPTTAVVSVQREVMSSGFGMETFLPSKRLRSKQSNDGRLQHCCAFWADDSSLALLKPEDRMTEPSTFEMIRSMQRESYRPDTTIGQLSSYVHERIDIHVSVGKGIEMIPLGIASIAITGDEEGEVIANVPVKPMAPGQPSRRYTVRTPRKKTSKVCFSEEPQYVFSLQENATLRVGIRVVPKKMIDQSELYMRKQMKMALDPIIEDSPDNHVFIELNDENSLLDNLLTRTSYHFGQDEALADDNSLCSQPRTPEVRMGGFFCGAADMKLCQGGQEVQYLENSSRLSSPQIASENALHRKKIHKRTTAKIMSLNIMSDMSESTFGSDTNTSFKPQRTEL